MRKQVDSPNYEYGGICGSAKGAQQLTFMYGDAHQAACPFQSLDSIIRRMPLSNEIVPSSAVISLLTPRASSPLISYFFQRIGKSFQSQAVDAFSHAKQRNVFSILFFFFEGDSCFQQLDPVVRIQENTLYMVEKGNPKIPDCSQNVVNSSTGAAKHRDLFTSQFYGQIHGLMGVCIIFDGI